MHAEPHRAVSDPLGRSGGQPRGVAIDGSVRLLVLWEHPRFCSIDDVRAWAERALAALREQDAVARIELVPLRPPSTDHMSGFDWLLEVYVCSGDTAAELVKSAPLRDFLGDLRSLRLGPVVLLVDDADVPQRKH